MRIFTIGYEGAPQPGLIAALAAACHPVRRVVPKAQVVDPFA